MHRAATFQPHAMQEVWELFQGDDSVPLGQPLKEATSSEKCFMAISQEAISGKEAVVLVDSRSTHFFISESLAAKLSG